MQAVSTLHESKFRSITHVGLGVILTHFGRCRFSTIQVVDLEEPLVEECASVERVCNKMVWTLGDMPPSHFFKLPTGISHSHIEKKNAAENKYIYMISLLNFQRNFLHSQTPLAASCKVSYVSSPNLSPQHFSLSTHKMLYIYHLGCRRKLELGTEGRCRMPSMASSWLILVMKTKDEFSLKFREWFWIYGCISAGILLFSRTQISWNMWFWKQWEGLQTEGRVIKYEGWKKAKLTLCVQAKNSQATYHQILA